MQFHPTALYGSENPTLLLTEALRGEGAYLRDDAGERFMVGSHPRAELAPRDVVVRHMKRVFDRDKTDHVWLDARHLDCPFLRERFPTVYNGLKARGYDLCTELIPIAPASHYFIGGALTDTWGRTTIPGLYACGETASTGIHGANRLASNSLLEGLGVRRSHGARAEPISFDLRPGGEEGPARPRRRAPAGERPRRGGRTTAGGGPAHDRSVRDRPHQGGVGRSEGVDSSGSRTLWPRRA